MTSLIGDDFWVTIGFVSLVASPLCLYSLYVRPDDERRRSYPKWMPRHRFYWLWFAIMTVMIVGFGLLWNKWGLIGELFYRQVMLVFTFMVVFHQAFALFINYSGLAGTIFGILQLACALTITIITGLASEWATFGCYVASSSLMSIGVVFMMWVYCRHPYMEGEEATTESGAAPYTQFTDKPSSQIARNPGLRTTPVSSPADLNTQLDDYLYA